MRALLLWVALVTTAPFAAGQNLTLANDGKSDYQIIIPANASGSEKRGAAELQSHFERMCGVKLAIATDAAPLSAKAILIGKTVHTAALLKGPLPALGDEGYLLRTAGPHLIIYGSNVRGAMYGCSALLERLGVRWYTPTVSFIPPLGAPTLPALNETHLPAFEYREVYCAEALDKDWAARLGLNGQSHPLDDSTGGKIRYSHFVHTFDDLIPREQIMNHPEYFPVIKGKRTGGYVQRCLTNPEVLRLATAAVLDWINKDPKALIYSVSQNDTFNFCECDECKKVEQQFGGAHSGLYLWFVNQVAEAVEKKHPDKLIDTLAYQFTEAPPTGIAPRKNVRVRLCPIAACTAHPYETCAAPPTIAFLKNLRGWSGITDTLSIWHYNTCFPHYLMPFPDFGEFPADIRLYQRSGVKGIFFEGAYGAGGGGSFAELQAYVMAHLMWDPNLDEKAMIRQWHIGVYGYAAPPMQKWFDLLHVKVADPKAHFFCFINPKKAPYLTDDVIAEGKRLFDQARQLAASNPVAAEYVEKARLGLRYVKLYQHPTTGPELGGFVEDLKKFKIGQISEHLSVSAWEKDYREKHK